ncbi:MAG: hypothetical protein ACK5CA_04425 [Cyanobacteriota bacterium]
MTAMQSPSPNAPLAAELPDFALQGNEPPLPPEIQSLKDAALAAPQDLVAKISLASALEQGGYLKEAAAEYEAIKALDTDQLFSASADRALRDIRKKLAKTTGGQDFRSYRQGATRVIEVKTPGDAWTTATPPYSETIRQLQQAVDQDPGDLVAKIALANALEQEGFLKDAAHLYEQIKALDGEGTFRGAAEKALTKTNAQSDPEQLLDRNNSDSKLEDDCENFSTENRQVLISLLHEYGQNLFKLCEEISDFQARYNLLTIFSPLMGVILFLFINQIFRTIFWQITSFVLLIFWIFIIYCAWRDRKKLNRIKYQARRIRTRLEKVIRLGYQIQENMAFNVITKVELDLRLADAESALEYYHELIKQSTFRRL